jgi:membrane protein implicated in regulation of membrane protease activity
MYGLSTQHRVFLVIQICLCLVAYHFWRHLPVPGWSVALIAFVAAAMSVHQAMDSWQKILWMVIIAVLLIVELRAISNDREASQQQALQDRKNQDESFKKVRDAQDKDFSATAAGLRDAISGISSTLQATNGTLRQTQPHAALRFGEFQIINEPTAPKLFQPGVEYQFNVSLQNYGNETGLITKRLAEIYVAKPDDLAVQKTLTQKFEGQWKALPKNEGPATVVPNVLNFWTEKHVFSDDEISALIQGPETVFVLRRIEYSDSTGTWWTDRCEHLQREGPQLFFKVTHPCLTFQNDRYRARRQ